MNKHRAVNFLSISCTAPDELFLPDWNDIPKEYQDQIEEYGMPCEGGGVPGIWCKDCHWLGNYGYDEDLVDDIGFDYLEWLNRE